MGDAGGYSAGPMNPGEADVVAAILGDSLASLRGAALTDRYRWSHQDNPAGPAHTVVARHGESGSVVGCGSVYPRQLRVGGKDLCAAIPADFAVDRGHRFGGAAVAIQRELLRSVEDRFSLFIAFPNRAALPVLRRVGYQPIATAQAWVKPIRVGYKLRERLGHGPLSRVVSAPADLALAGLDAWRLGRTHAAFDEIVSCADERFDRLWARARDRYPAAGERTAAYLNWRYRGGTGAHRFFCLGEVDSGELRGYLAFHIRDDKAFVDDLFAVDMAEGAEALILHFARRMREQAIQSICIVYAGNAAFTARLGRLGFIARPATSRQLVGLVTHPACAQLLDGRNWFLFEGEMDV